MQSQLSYSFQRNSIYPIGLFDENDIDSEDEVLYIDDMLHAREEEVS